jgi:hypothetical protein
MKHRRKRPRRSAGEDGRDGGLRPELHMLAPSKSDGALGLHADAPVCPSFPLVDGDPAPCNLT